MTKEIANRTASEIEKLSADLNRLCTPARAAQAVAMLIAASAHRQGLSDEEAAEMTMRRDMIKNLLTHYPISVVEELIDPFRGIVGNAETKFMPTVQEVKQFADRIVWKKANRLTTMRTDLKQLASRAAIVPSEERERQAQDAIIVKKAIQDKAAADKELFDKIAREAAGKRKLPPLKPQFAEPGYGMRVWQENEKREARLRANEEAQSPLPKKD